MTTLTRAGKTVRIIIEFDGPPPGIDAVAQMVADALANPPTSPPPVSDTAPPAGAYAGSPPTTGEQQGTHAWLLDFAGCASDLPTDFAEQHDHYIHGTPRQ